jgi:hypothetical protein
MTSVSNLQSRFMKMFFIPLMAILAIACDDGPGSRIPECMDQKIAALKHQPVRNPAASITMITTTKGEIYFYVPPYCCDFYGELYDDQCNLVCYPDGGLSGQGNGICPEYLILKEEVIWQDKRGQ